MSLARRHRERHAAAALAGLAMASPASSRPVPEATEYERMLAQLGEDLRTLSNIQSVERKIETKRQMIGLYDAWIEGALRAGANGGKAAQDEIVTTMLVWHIDVGSWIMALQLAVHVLTHGLTLPERYKRTPATLIAEEIADAALADVKAVDHGTLIATAEITDRHDMPDQVRAKLQKAIGRKLMQEAEQFDPEADNAVAGGKGAILQAALEAMQRALKLDEKSGVKKDIETLERELKKLPSATEPANR